MNDQLQDFSQGDWVVHLVYGVGQIKAIEKKTIAGDAQKYFRVKIQDGSYWVPVGEPESGRVRPLASKEEILEALEILKEDPDPMAKNYKTRRKRIMEDALDGDLDSDLVLIRDLTARQYDKGLNDGDKTSLDRVKARLVKEMAVSFGIRQQEAEDQLETLLKNCRRKKK